MKVCARCSSHPVPYLLVLIAVFATFLQQSAFHAGSLQTSVPTMLVLEPVIAVLLGAIVLGENLDVSHLDAVLITISTVAMAAATVALGRDEGAYEEQLEAAVAQRLRLASSRNRLSAAVSRGPSPVAATPTR